MIIASNPASNLFDIFAANTRPSQPMAKSKDVNINYSSNFAGHTTEIKVTGGQAIINISEDMDGALVASINDTLHTLNVSNDRNNTLIIKTDHYDDSIIIENGVKLKARIQSGAGNDYIKTGDRRSTVDAGDGDNEVHLGAEGGLARGGNGDDKLYGGGMWNSLAGGKGTNLFSTSLDPRSTTTIDATGTKETISALAGRALIEVSGSADIHVAAGLDKPKIFLGSHSAGSNITLDDPKDAHSNLEISGFTEGRDTVAIKQTT